MNWYHWLLSVCIVFKLCQVTVSSNTFVIQPPNPLVGTYGSYITFRWKVDAAIYYRNWKYNGDILAQVNSKNETYEQINIYEAYKSRVSFPFGSPELTLQNLTFADIGRYSCEVILEDGRTAESSTQLKIYVTPVFTHFPAIYKAVEYNNINLTCTVSSRPALDNITWVHSGGFASNRDEQISLKHESGMLASTSGTLMLRNISRHSHGEYKCIAKHYLGQFNRTASLLVYTSPIISRFPKKDIHSIELSNVYIHCEAIGYPLPLINWYKDNKLINHSCIHYHIHSFNSTYNTSQDDYVSSILTIRNVTHEDFGYYTCEAVNVLYQLGERRVSESIYVFVRYPPVLLVNSTNQNVSSKSNGFEISCESKSFPPVTEYKWSKDGMDMFHNQSIFRVNEVNISYQGTYRCRAENTEGEGDTVTHVITVLVSPGISRPATCYPDRGMLYCSCAGFGYPPIEIYWTKSPSDIILSNQHTLNISINLNVSGTYICHLKNSHGVTKTSNQITALFSEWSSWYPCNASCGGGNSLRNRSCLIPPCQGQYMEVKRCATGVCPVLGMSAQMYWHKDWYIIFWVLIPILVILILICILWMARRHRNTNKAVFVTSNRNTSDVPPTIRNIQTRPDIYLPTTPNTFSAINNGYMDEEREKQDKESMEVVMYLAEDTNNPSIWFSPPHNSPINNNNEHQNSPEDVTVSPYNKPNDSDRYMEVNDVPLQVEMRRPRDEKRDIVDIGDRMSALTDDMDGSSVYL